MDIFAARQTIIAALTTLLSSAVPAKNIIAHRGQFESIDEIKRIALASPSVLVCFRGRQNSEAQGLETIGEVQWVVYVIAEDKRGAMRNVTATSVAFAIEDYLARNANAWAFAEGAAERLTSADITSLAVDQTGLALWQVTWLLKCRLSTLDPLAALTHFDGFDAEHFKVGANELVDLPKAKTKADY